MSGRGFGGGRRGGRGRGGAQRWVRETPLETFPEIEGFEPLKTSMDEARKYFQFVNWSNNLQKFCETSPYYYEDSCRRLENVQKADIERYSDRNLPTTKVKPPLWHFVKMDKDHMPEEIAKGTKQVAKKVRWDLDMSKLNRFEKLEEKHQGKEEEEKKESEDEDEEENDEEDGEFSDEGDYEQGEDFDDDEDDFNMEEEIEEPEY